MANYDTSIRVHAQVDNSDIIKTEKEVEKLAAQLERVRERSRKVESLGGTEKQLQSLGYDAEKLEEKLADATERLEQLRANANKKFSLSDFVNQRFSYENLYGDGNGLDLSKIVSVDELKSGFAKAKESAKNCFKTIKEKGAASNKSLSNIGRTLRSIILSMIVFKGLSKATQFTAEGFNNLVQYSSRLNSAFSSLKSETATLKNNLATAFAPVVEMIIPYLVKLVGWLNTACNAIAQFFAVLQGKSTFTKAKKQVIDYAKSLKTAQTAAKGALAAFDEINVLDNGESGGAAGGGEATGADAFVEAEVDKSKFEWVEWLKDNLDTILTIVGAIGLGLLAWKIASGFTNDLGVLVGIAMAVAGAFIFIRSALDAWVNGVSWKNLGGMLLGVTLLLGGLALAFGPLAAGIASVVAGAAMIIVGIHDIMENGINLKNGILVVAGVFTSLFLTAGAVVAAIAALVAGLVLAVAADWENFKKTVWEPIKKWGQVLLSNFTQIGEGIKKIFSGVITFFKGVFTGDWKMIWTGIKTFFTGVWDVIIGCLKASCNFIFGALNTAYNAICGVINACISAINKISFTVPDWVPVLGGKQFGGFNLSPIQPVNIPYLETGGIVTSATRAVIGENGREAVLPLENHTEWMDELADRIGNNDRPITIKFTGSLSELGRILKPVIEIENGRIGTSLVVN